MGKEMNATAILDTFTTDDNEAVTEVSFTVLGGTSHEARQLAARDALEAFTNRTPRAVTVDDWEVVPAWDMYGAHAVKFRFYTPELVGTPQQTPLAG